jgi:DNA-binding MarR family transcriptional regulator/RimJ/RimL family protein N-acetyltransferase
MKHLSDQNINLLRQNARSMVRELGLLNDAYSEIGITLAQRHLLIELSSTKEPLTAKEIAERLLLDKSTVSRLIAKAVRRGFITCSIDQKDKRKRFLQFTDLGKNTLFTFEPIAFNQTKNALQTLTPEETNFVYQGMALYAQGLKNSRLQNTIPTSLEKIEKLEELHHQLHQLGYKLEPYKLDDEKELFAIFKEVVETGRQFPYESSSKEEFYTQFFSPTSQVYVCRSSQDHVVGGFYLKPNYSGRSRHIANAAYMIKNTHRGLGIGTLLIKSSLQIAKNLNFLAMQFNMVLSQNTGAIKLYEKLGFKIIGTIPNAIRNSDGSFQDGHSMYRRVDDL